MNLPLVKQHKKSVSMSNNMNLGKIIDKRREIVNDFLESKQDLIKYEYMNMIMNGKEDDLISFLINEDLNGDQRTDYIRRFKKKSRGELIY